MFKNTLAAISLVALCAACQQKQPAEPVKEAAPAQLEKATDWNAFVDTFIEDFFAAHPTFAVTSGRHEYDGQLPDWSRDGIAAEITRLHKQRDTALAFDAAIP